MMRVALSSGTNAKDVPYGSIGLVYLVEDRTPRDRRNTRDRSAFHQRPVSSLRNEAWKWKMRFKRFNEQLRLLVVNNSSDTQLWDDHF